jgi:hypothetical protein
MKPLSIFGIVLVVAGLAALVFGEINVPDRETLVKVGDAKIETETTKSIQLPQVAGIAAVGAGVVILFVGLRRR